MRARIVDDSRANKKRHADRTETEQVAKALAAGANEHVMKPFSKKFSPKN